MNFIYNNKLTVPIIIIIILLFECAEVGSALYYVAYLQAVKAFYSNCGKSLNASQQMILMLVHYLYTNTIKNG